MDAHANEAAAAVAAMQESYGTSPGRWDGNRRTWEPGEYVLFYYRGDICRGHVMDREDGIERDTYRIRRHVPGNGSEVVEVIDRAIQVF